MYLIGSRAIVELGHKFYREPKDHDYVMKERYCGSLKTSHDGNRIEYSMNPILCDWIENHEKFASIETLYTLKLSHSHYDIHWNKTLNDIRWFQKNGIEYIPELYFKLKEHWKGIHSNKRKEPNFDVSNDEFFYDKIERKKGHDDLHQMMKFGKRPIFEKLKYDMSMAKIEEELFNALSHENKIKVVTEEMFVLAVERRSEMVERNCMVACARTLKDLVTRLLPDWLALFAMLNFNEILNMSKILKEIYNREKLFVLLS